MTLPKAMTQRPQGCILSRIAGKNITHKVIEHEDFGLKIVSAGGSRQDARPLFWGTYKECNRYINSY